MLKTKNGKPVASIGQGTWYLGESQRFEDEEIETLKMGINKGMNLIDTAEMYGSGGAEVLTGKAISSFPREDLYIVSKVYPFNSSKENIIKACSNSLKRLNTSYIDLYLLHWRGSNSLSEVVEGMEELKERGMIRDWGVSNFDIRDMEELFKVENGDKCLVNQVLYNLDSRGVEFSLLPWMQERNVVTMAYCPLAQGGKLSKGLLENELVKDIARVHNSSPAQVLLAFLCSKALVVPIPRTKQIEYAIQNAEAMDIKLTKEELDRLDQEFPPPNRKMPLDIQ